MQPSPFLCGQQICILPETMTPSAHPSTSSLRPLNPATSHNSRLHARVRAAEDIEPFLKLTRLVVECESQQQFVITGPHKRFWFPCTSYFHLLVVFGFFVCLFVYSAQALCACFFSVFGECQSPPIGLEYELQCFRSFSGTVWTQILKR